jgi:hypothetical protein
LFLEEKATPKLQVEKTAVPQQATARVELTIEQLEKRAGTYFCGKRSAWRQVTYAEGRLWFRGFELVPLSENLFFFKGDSHKRVEFITPKDGTVIGMKTITSSDECEYDRVEPVCPAPSELLKYAGRYYSPELDVTWTLVANDDHLVAYRRRYVTSKLTPLFRDIFTDNWEPLMGYPTTYLVAFKRDESDAITALCVSGTRVRNLRFIKQGI